MSCENESLPIDIPERNVEVYTEVAEMSEFGLLGMAHELQFALEHYAAGEAYYRDMQNQIDPHPSYVVLEGQYSRKIGEILHSDLYQAIRDRSAVLFPDINLEGEWFGWIGFLDWEVKEIRAQIAQWYFIAGKDVCNIKPQDYDGSNKLLKQTKDFFVNKGLLGRFWNSNDLNATFIEYWGQAKEDR